MVNWVETPDELAERQEDRAQDPGYDHDPYRAWPGPGVDSDGVPLAGLEWPCIVCGAEIAPALADLGSLTCHDHRPVTSRAA